LIAQDLYFKGFVVDTSKGQSRFEFKAKTKFSDGLKKPIEVYFKKREALQLKR